MDSSKFANALKTALSVVPPTSPNWPVSRILLDDDVPRWSKATLVCMLKEHLLEEHHITISLDMFSPFCTMSDSPFWARTHLMVFLDNVIENMAGEFTPQLVSLLETHSHRGGQIGKRILTDYEIDRMIMCTDAGMLHAINYAIRHLCMAAHVVLS